MPKSDYIPSNDGAFAPSSNTFTPEEKMLLVYLMLRDHERFWRFSGPQTAWMGLRFHRHHRIACDCADVGVYRRAQVLPRPAENYRALPEEGVRRKASLRNPLLTLPVLLLIALVWHFRLPKT